MSVAAVVPLMMTMTIIDDDIDEHENDGAEKAYSPHDTDKLLWDLGHKGVCRPNPPRQVVPEGQVNSLVCARCVITQCEVEAPIALNHVQPHTRLHMTSSR